MTWRLPSETTGPAAWPGFVLDRLGTNRPASHAKTGKNAKQNIRNLCALGAPKVAVREIHISLAARLRKQRARLSDAAAATSPLRRQGTTAAHAESRNTSVRMGRFSAVQAFFEVG